MDQTIKVFISSTFRDLEDERDYIVKHLLKNLQEKLDGISVASVDLRWGITDEQARSGRVVDLCLRYLYESRPLLIGILGDRYGSSFDAAKVQLSPLVSSVYPNAMKEISDGLSITEVEIINGALDNTSDDICAFFLVKDSAAPYPGESDAQYRKLQALKQRVLTQQRYPVIRYNSLADIDQLLDPLEKAVRQKFNIKEKDEKRNELLLDHPGLEVKWNMDKRRKMYEKVQPADMAMLDCIENIIEQGEPCSIIEGAPGIGKSTLVAQLANRNSRYGRHYIYIYGDEQKLPLSDKILFDYLFVSAKQMLQEEENGEFEDDMCLLSAIVSSRWCFVIDNTDTDFCNQDVPFHHFPGIIRAVADWLKKEYNAELNYKILYVQSTDSQRDLPGADSMPCYRMECSNCFVPEKVLQKHLSVYSKNMDIRLLHTIASSPAARIPGALMLICDYLCENVHHEELSAFAQKVSTLSTYESVIELYLGELQKECSREAVAKIVALLAVYKSGLTRTELRALSGESNRCVYTPGSRKVVKGQVNELTLNITLSYLEKFLSSQYDGRLHFRNKFMEELLVRTFGVTESQKEQVAKDCIGHFSSQVKDLNHTQEDFVIESNKNFWQIYRVWENVIPDWVYLYHPQDQSNGGIWGDPSMEVRRRLSICGGMSYENACKAYYFYKIERTRNLSKQIGEVKAKLFQKKISQEEANREIDRLAEQLWKKMAETRNPFHTDVLHLFESGIALSSVDTVKHLAINPVFVNRILNTGTLVSAWRWLTSQGVPLCDEGIRKNTLFSATAFRNIALMLDDSKAEEFYSIQNSFRLFTPALPKFPSSQFYKTTKHENGQYSGEYDFLNRPHGSGIYFWYDKNLYIGEFKHGKRHGEGKYYYSDGVRYYGQWNKDNKDGHGVLVFPDGRKYSGGFKMGDQEGEGRYRFKNGDIYEGTFKNGHFHGKGIYRWYTGGWMSAEWKNGTLLEGTRQDHISE